VPRTNGQTTRSRPLIRASEQLDSKKESRYQYAPIIRVAIGTGLRLGELLGLEWRDIDLEHGVL
jgi:integrase